MTRTKRETIHALFRAVHANRDVAPLPAAWRRGVMNAIIREDAQDEPLLRLAPRFTLAAAAVSAIGLVAGSWTIPQLVGDVGGAYTSLLLDMASSAWTLL